MTWLRMLVGALACSALTSLQAQDERGDVDRAAMDCITLPRIDRTEVIDDRTILFYARGNRVYRNYLPMECPGLEREKRFLYEVRGDRLCSVDTVSVLETWGVGVMRGFTCRLGSFYPMTEDEVEELKVQTGARDERETRAERRQRRENRED